MAQQQDQNADVARGIVGQPAIAAGSQDTYKPKGFQSPTTTPPANSLSGITTAPAPETYSWGKYSGPKTPGVMAATGAGGSGQPGAANIPGLGSGAVLNQLGLGGKWMSNVLGQNNNSLAQDIGGALYQGLPISDAKWAQFGYGPGGATLATGAGAQQPTALPNTLQGAMVNNLRGITAAPSTMPSNAVLRY